MRENGLGLLGCVAALLLGGCAIDPARLHRQLLTLDTHLDTPALLSVQGWNITERHAVNVDGSQVDLPRMDEGGLDGGFWVTFIGQGPLTLEGRTQAREAAFRRLDQIHAMVRAHPDKFGLAMTANEARRVVQNGRKIVILSMENGYPFGEDLSLLQQFYAKGVRVAGPVHTAHNDLGTSATDARAAAHGEGLSELGERWVREANRLGILIDASHASNAVLDGILAISTAPIILTHSGASAVFDHPRNVDDEHLRRVAAKGGVIQVLAFSDYMIRNAPQPERTAAIAANRRNPPPNLEALQAQRRRLNEINAQFPQRRATFEDFMQHLLHVIKFAGIDHVGIGADFDGGGGVEGLDEASDYPKITARLLQEGYSRADLAKLWSGNTLRVLDAAQRAAANP